MLSRRAIRPVYNRDEDEDEQRRDSSGRKRVDVIDCLLESSSSDDDEHSFNSKSNQIVWLTFDEISHIRSVLSRTFLSPDERFSSSSMSTSWKFFGEQICFHCGKQLKTSIFIPLIFSSSTCFICQQRICQTCSIDHYLPPSSTQMLPVYLPHLLQMKTFKHYLPIQTNNQTNSKGKTICYACAQVKHPRSILCRTSFLL